MRPRELERRADRPELVQGLLHELDGLVRVTALVAREGERGQSVSQLATIERRASKLHRLPGEALRANRVALGQERAGQAPGQLVDQVAARGDGAGRTEGLLVLLERRRDIARLD
jgi:hypothetical protein